MTKGSRTIEANKTKKKQQTADYTYNAKSTWILTQHAVVASRLFAGITLPFFNPFL